MKNTLLDVAQNFDKMSDLEKAKANDKIRENVKEIMKSHPKLNEKKNLTDWRRKKKKNMKETKMLSMLILFIGTIISVEDMGYLY